MRVREVLLEVEDVPDVGAAEAVDRLVVVADHRQVAVLGGEQLEPAVLGAVGVLVLVDEDVAERARVAVADLLEELEHVDRADEQVVEVHRVACGAARARSARRRRRPSARSRSRPAGGTPRPSAACSWRRRSGPASRAGVKRLGSMSRSSRHRLDQPARVGRVVDRELARVAEPVGVGAQHPRAGGVEGHHPHRARRAADEQLDALAHLLRGLVGERDREDLVRARRPVRIR